MNKPEFIEKLVAQTGLSQEQCEKVNQILEEIPIIGKTNKEKMVAEFQRVLNLTEEKAEELYGDAASVISQGVKDKLKHPFGA